MAFQLQNWSAPGMSLAYRPMAQQLLPKIPQLPPVVPRVPGGPGGGGGGGGGGPGVGPGGGLPGFGGGAFGQYNPRAPIPIRPGVIGPNDSMPLALDKLMQGTGLLGLHGTGPGQRIDPNKARAMQALVQPGMGAGKGRQQRQNEEMLSSLLSLGAAGQPKGKGKGKGKGGGFGILGPLTGGPMPVETKKPPRGKNKKG